MPQYKFIEGSEAGNPTILKFENLEEDFHRFYGEPLDVKFNVSEQNKNYRTYYTVYTAALVEVYYEEDFR